MRGLVKPRPPANVSPDGQEPRSFADAEQEYLAALPGLVGFTSGGEMYVRDDVDMDEATRRGLELAIDESQSPDARGGPTRGAGHRARAHEEDVDNRIVTREEREQRATQLLRRVQLPASVSIRVAWLRDALGRGQ